MDLLKEAETIQKDLRVPNKPSTIAAISKKSTREMSKDNINSVMKLLVDKMQNGILSLHDQTCTRCSKNTHMIKLQIQKYS